MTEKLVDAAKKNSKNGVTLENAMGELAKAIAGEVDAYIKTMTITIASGFVQVQVSPPECSRKRLSYCYRKRHFIAFRFEMSEKHLDFRSPSWSILIKKFFSHLFKLMKNNLYLIQRNICSLR